MTGHLVGDARKAQAAPEPDTDRLAALLAEHAYGAGSQGRYCRCGAMGVGDRQRNHAAHVAAVLAEAGVGFIAEAERDLLDGTWRARAERAEAALALVRAWPAGATHVSATVEALIARHRAEAAAEALRGAADDVAYEVRQLDVGCEADAGYYDAHMEIRKMLRDRADRIGGQS